MAHKKHEPGCPCCGCAIFADDFDRGGPTQDIGQPWQWATSTGEWWIDGSTRPKTGNDSALFEVTGTGEMMLDVQSSDEPGKEGQGISIQTIDEVAHATYRVLLCAETHEVGCDCLIAEFWVGDNSIYEDSEIRLYSRSGSVETLLDTKAFPCPTSNSQYGRTFYTRWIGDGDNLFCAWVTHTAHPSQVTVRTSAPGLYAGLANASGSGIPIEIDDYQELALEQNDTPCIACVCVCYEHETWDDCEAPVTVRALYPYSLTLTMKGQCCTPFFTPCDLGGCPSALDLSIELTLHQDYPADGWQTWYNVEELEICGYPFEFRLVCDGCGRLALEICYEPYVGSGWVQIPLSGAIVLTRLGHTCSPIRDAWHLLLNSLSGFPCCVGCTRGEYEIVITG